MTDLTRYTINGARAFGEILLIQGIWDEAEKELDSAASIAKRMKDPEECRESSQRRPI